LQRLIEEAKTVLEEKEKRNEGAKKLLHENMLMQEEEVSGRQLAFSDLVQNTYKEHATLVEKEERSCMAREDVRKGLLRI